MKNLRNTLVREIETHVYLWEDGISVKGSASPTIINMMKHCLLSNVSFYGVDDD